jgi:hypothetical protein
MAYEALEAVQSGLELNHFSCYGLIEQFDAAVQKQLVILRQRLGGKPPFKEGECQDLRAMGQLVVDYGVDKKQSVATMGASNNYLEI